MIARIHPFSALEALSRRRFLAGSGATLSAAAVALMAGRPALAAAQAGTQDDTASDVRILNTALSAELEAIAAYAVGAGSGLLQKPALDLALQFQGHHKEHADALAKTVRKLGGTPAEARERYVFPTDKLKNQADVLGFAAGLERGVLLRPIGDTVYFMPPYVVGEAEIAHLVDGAAGALDEALA